MSTWTMEDGHLVPADRGTAEIVADLLDSTLDREHANQARIDAADRLTEQDRELRNLGMVVRALQEAVGRLAPKNGGRT